MQLRDLESDLQFSGLPSNVLKMTSLEDISINHISQNFSACEELCPCAF